MSEYNEEDVQPQEDEQGEDHEGDGDEPDYKALYEKAQEDLEKTRKDKNGLLAKLGRQKEAKPKSQDDSRLDRLELLQIDRDLTDDQINEALTIKRAKGYSTAREAYGDGMFSAFLNSQRAAMENDNKIANATPNPDKKGGSAPQAKASPTNSSRDWAKEIPKNADLNDVADALADRFLSDN